MNVGAIDIFIASFLAFTSIYLILTVPVRRKRRIARDRIEKFSHDKSHSAMEEESAPIVITRQHLSTIPAFNRLLNKLNAAAALGNLLEQAGLTMTVGSLVLLMLFMAGIAFVFALRLENVGITVLATIGAGLLPLAWVVQKKKRRLKNFERHFPDALDLMTSALRAGLSFVGALKMVGAEAHDPISHEFTKTYEEQALGVPIEECLDRLTKRIESLDLKFFVTALQIQRDIGGNLTELLEKIGLTIRERFKLIGQVRAQTAQGRFTGWMLSGMPFVMGGIIALLNAEYIKQLFTVKLGQYMVAGALFLQFLGFFVIRKVVNIKP